MYGFNYYNVLATRVGIFLAVVLYYFNVTMTLSLHTIMFTVYSYRH